MNNEKILYMKLPAGAVYRRLEVTEDGGINIFYTEECVENEETPEKTAKVSAVSSMVIPKPEPLIGGTEVYQKDNGLPYWYCKIKAGRDEFMCLYFGDLTEQDLLYDEKGEERKFVTHKQKEFKANVENALKNKPKEGFRWLPVYEPSEDFEGNLQYISGVQVLMRRHSSIEWKKFFEDYSQKNGSRMAPDTTHFLLLLRWLKDGVATLEQIADDSSHIGHYWTSENAKHKFEKTGERHFGGLFGFVGNTYKIVEDSKSYSGISLVGGSYVDYGNEYPLAGVGHDVDSNGTKDGGVGLLELIK